MFNLELDNGIVFSHKDNVIEDSFTTFQSHMHDNFELIYFVKGDVDFTVEQNTRHLEPGDFILIAPGKYHHAYVNASTGCDRYVFRFPVAKAFKPLCDSLTKREPFFTNCQKIGLITQFFDDYYDKYEGYVLGCLFQSELLKILALLCHSAENTPQIGLAMIDEAIKYINLHLQEPLYLDDIANHCKVSKLALSIEFKDKVGITIMHYVAAKRAIATNEAIANGMKKGDAAKKFGYNDYSTFYRGYKKLQSINNKAVFNDTF